MAISIFEKNGQKIEVPTEALGKAMSDVSGGYVTGQTEQQRLESLGYKLLSPYSGEKVTDGSAEIRTDLNVINNNLNKLPTTGGYDFNQTDYLNDKQKSQLDAITNFSMDLTAQDKADIEAAGFAAGLKYDPLIKEAQEEKRKGMPKAVISAGERGGFMSTQMAGATANPMREEARRKMQELSDMGMVIEGDGISSWVGEGGELKNIKDVYDVNISNLETAKLRAIEEAKAAAQAAKISGKREDRKAMMEAFEFAQNAHLKQIQLANERVQAVSNYNKLISDKKNTDLGKISELATLGIGLNANLIAEIDSLYGKGYAQKYYEVSKAAKEVQGAEDAIKLQKDLYDLLSKVPVGKKIKIGDATYEGLGEDKNNQIFSESDARGTTYVTIDKKTGNIVNSKFLPGVGVVKSSGSGSSEDEYFTRPIDGVVKYFYGKPNNWQNAQELTPEEFRKGKSIAESTMPEPTYTYSEKKEFLKNASTNYGDDVKSVKEAYFKKFGSDDPDYGQIAVDLGLREEEWDWNEFFNKAASTIKDIVI